MQAFPKVLHQIMLLAHWLTLLVDNHSQSNLAAQPMVVRLSLLIPLLLHRMLVISPRKPLIQLRLFITTLHTQEVRLSFWILHLCSSTTQTAKLSKAAHWLVQVVTLPSALPHHLPSVLTLTNQEDTQPVSKSDATIPTKLQSYLVICNSRRHVFWFLMLQLIRRSNMAEMALFSQMLLTNSLMEQSAALSVHAVWSIQLLEVKFIW